MVTQEDASDTANRLSRVSLSSSASSSTGSVAGPKAASSKKGKKESARKGDAGASANGNSGQSNGRGGKASSSGDVQICFDFTKGTCSRGENCRFSHDIATIVNVNSKERGICFDFVRGQCNRGLLCRFSHDLTNLNQSPAPVRAQKSGAICYDYVKGACSRGNDCRYSHDINSIASSFRAIGVSAEICYDFSRGRCTRGAACRYSHDTRAVSAATASAVTTVPARGSQQQAVSKKPVVVPVTSSAAEGQQQANAGSTRQVSEAPREHSQLPPLGPSQLSGSRYVDVLGSNTQTKTGATASSKQAEEQNSNQQQIQQQQAQSRPPPPPPPSQQQQHVLHQPQLVTPSHQQQPVQGNFRGVGVGIIGAPSGGSVAIQQGSEPLPTDLSYGYSNGVHGSDRQQQQQHIMIGDITADIGRMVDAGLEIVPRQQQQMMMMGDISSDIGRMVDPVPDGVPQQQQMMMMGNISDMGRIVDRGLKNAPQQQPMMGDIAADIGRMIDTGLEGVPQQQQQMIMGGNGGLASAPLPRMGMNIQQRPTAAQVAQSGSQAPPFEFPQARAAPPPPPRTAAQQQRIPMGWGKDQIMDRQQQRSTSGPLLSGDALAEGLSALDPVLPQHVDHSQPGLDLSGYSMTKAASANGFGALRFNEGSTAGMDHDMAQPNWNMAPLPPPNNGMNQNTLGNLRQIWNR